MKYVQNNRTGQINLTASTPGDVGAEPLLTGATVDTAPENADTVYGGNSGSSFATIKTTWTTIKSFLNTYFAGIYQSLSCLLSTKNDTGWDDWDNVGISYDSANRTVTVTHTGNLYYWWRGVKYELGTAGSWTSTAHATTLDTAYFLYSTDGTNFTWTTTPWEFDYVMAAYIWYGTSIKFGIAEHHGCARNIVAHEEFHRTVGTYRESGGTLSGYTLASTTATNRRPLVSATVIHDEDNMHTLAAISNETNAYTVMTLSGAGATTAFTVAQADIVPLLANNPYWNKWDGAAWIQTLMANNTYMSIWLFAIPVTDDAGSQSYRYIWQQGQSNGNLATEQSLTPLNLNKGNIIGAITEGVYIGRVIIHYIGGNWQWQEVEVLTGTRALTIGTIAGAYLSTVATDATLTGNGTLTLPLTFSGVLPVRTVTSANATFATTDYIIRMDTGATNRTVNLAAATVGETLIVKKVDSGAGTVTFVSGTSCTIDGSTTIALSVQYATIALQCVTAGASCVFDRIDKVTWD